MNKSCPKGYGRVGVVKFNVTSGYRIINCEILQAPAGEYLKINMFRNTDTEYWLGFQNVGTTTAIIQTLNFRLTLFKSTPYFFYSTITATYTA